MKRTMWTALTVAAMTTLAGSAYAAPELQRVRGTVEKSDAGTLTVKTNEGTTQTVQIEGATFAWVVKSSLDQIKDGVFIGTATKGNNPPTALEVVLFPEEMRGTAEGHYAWDAIPDQTGGGSVVKSSMTNGTVKAGGASGAAGGAPKVKSSMTNATVTGNTASGASGERTLTVTYDKDGSKTIVVPPKAPIVAFEKSDKSVLTPGGKVFVVAAKDGDKLTAKLVAVGKDGLTPPM